MAPASRTSVTYTALIFAGIALAIAGAVVAILGLGGVTVFEGKAGGAEVKTQSVGLAIMVVGAVLAGTVALKLPKGVTVLSPSEASVTERVAERAPILFLVAGSAVVLLIVSLVFD